MVHQQTLVATGNHSTVAAVAEGRAHNRQTVALAQRTSAAVAAAIVVPEIDTASAVFSPVPTAVETEL